MDNGFNQRRQWNGENTPQKPTDRRKSRPQNTHQRMQIHRFGEKHRYRGIAIQRLNNRDKRRTRPKSSPAKLKQRYLPEFVTNKGADIGIRPKSPPKYRQQ